MKLSAANSPVGHPPPAQSRDARGTLCAVTLAALFLAALVGLIWLMLGPPGGFPGFVRDTSTPDAGRRIALFASALGRGRSALDREAYAWAVRAAWIALLLVHLLAVIAVRRWPRPRAIWLGLPVVAQIVALAYPPTSADLFYYAISGQAAAHGLNPYLVTPSALAHDPLLPLNFWIGITSPYGPLWTSFSRGLVELVGADPLRISLAFKITAALGALAVAWLAYALANRLRPGSGLVAFVIVAWHPIMIIESGGTAHQDALMMALALLGLLLLAMSRPRLAMLFIAASALIKYVTLPLLGFAALVRLRPPHWWHVIHAWLIDLAAILALAVIVSWPYWADGDMIRSMVAEPGRLYSNPLAVAAHHFAVAGWGYGAGDQFRADSRPVAQAVAIAIVVAVAVWLAAQTRRAKPAGSALLRCQLQAWVVAMVALSVLPVNIHPWYSMWAIGPVAALTSGREHWLWPYLCLIGYIVVAYHTQVAGGYGWIMQVHGIG